MSDQLHPKQNLVSPKTQDMLNSHHSPNLSFHQCGSRVVQTINAPLPLVWSVVRRFEYPQGYKKFVKKCTMVAGDGGIGSVREVMVMSGLPAGVSVERLDQLDDDLHVLKFSITGGDHRLVNYRSTITLHEEEEDRHEGKTVAIESYVVDIPAGSSSEDTCIFVNTIIGCNLRSLAKIAEQMVWYSLRATAETNPSRYWMTFKGRLLPIRFSPYARVRNQTPNHLFKVPNYNTKGEGTKCVRKVFNPA